MSPETYLNDGVHASHDGYQITLRTETCTIHLTRETYADLQAFALANGYGVPS